MKTRSATKREKKNGPKQLKIVISRKDQDSCTDTQEKKAFLREWAIKRNMDNVRHLNDVNPEKPVQFMGLHDYQINYYLAKLGFKLKLNGYVMTYKTIQGQKIAVIAAGVFVVLYAGSKVRTWRPKMPIVKQIKSEIQKADRVFVLLAHQQTTPKMLGRRRAWPRILDRVDIDFIPNVDWGNHLTLLEFYKTDAMNSADELDWNYYDSNSFSVSTYDGNVIECEKRYKRYKNATMRQVKKNLEKWFGIEKRCFRPIPFPNIIAVDNGCALVPLWIIEQAANGSGLWNPLENVYTLMVYAYKVDSYVGGIFTYENRPYWRHDQPYFAYQKVLDYLESLSFPSRVNCRLYSAYELYMKNTDFSKVFLLPKNVKCHKDW